MKAVQLSRSDAKKALVNWHFRPCSGHHELFDRLKSIQFDPLAPVGSNHDLVLHSRLDGYKVGDWQKWAYEERFIYDGWDKQASIIPITGWPVRQVFRSMHRKWWERRVLHDHQDAVKLVLDELEVRGPMLPKEFDFQSKRAEWQQSWYGPSVTKNVLRALWHCGEVMTAGRKGSQHLYDLTSRILPPEILNAPAISDEEAILELVHLRHQTMGLLRTSSTPEIWSNQLLNPRKTRAVRALADQERLIKVDVEGQTYFSPPGFTDVLDLSPPPLEARFIAPLDPFMWDRKMIGSLFGFDYVWEVYVPEAKRKWGYYVLPILFGDQLPARAEFWARKGVLEIRQWHMEAENPGAKFWPAVRKAIKKLMTYSSCTSLTFAPHIPSAIQEMLAEI